MRIHKTSSKDNKINRNCESGGGRCGNKQLTEDDQWPKGHHPFSVERRKKTREDQLSISDDHTRQKLRVSTGCDYKQTGPAGNTSYSI